MATRNFDCDYDWSRSLSERIKGMKDTALGIVWKKGREQKMKEIELLKAYNWLIAAGFPQYVQLHRENNCSISSSQVVEANKFLEKPMMEALLKRICILNQNVKLRLSEPVDVEKLIKSNRDFTYTLSNLWQLDQADLRWIFTGCTNPVNDGGECNHDVDPDRNESAGRDDDSRNCPSSTSLSPRGTASPIRRSNKKKSDTKKNGRWSKNHRVDDDGGGSSDMVCSTPLNSSSLTSSEFKANLSGFSNAPDNVIFTSGGVADGKSRHSITEHSSGLPNGHEHKQRKSSLQQELNRSMNLLQQCRSIRNFFKNFSDKISFCKVSPKLPKQCQSCQETSSKTQFLHPRSEELPKISKRVTCSDSFLTSASAVLPGIRIHEAQDSNRARCKSENCLSCHYRGCRNSDFNARCSAYECLRLTATHLSTANNPPSTENGRKNIECPPAGEEAERSPALLSLESPRRDSSNSSSCSPHPSSKTSSFRKMNTVPDKMERLSGEESYFNITIPYYFPPLDSPRQQHLSTGEEKSQTGDSCYLDWFEGSNNSYCMTSSDNAGSAVVVNGNGDGNGNRKGSQSDESQKSSYHSFEACHSFRQKELESILNELHNKINSLDKIRFNVDRDALEQFACSCGSNLVADNSETNDQEDREAIFKTFSAEKAKFFNLEPSCVLPQDKIRSKTCENCHPRAGLRPPAEDQSPETASAAAATDANNDSDVSSKELSHLTARELFVLRKMALIHLSSITDKYLMSNVDNLLARMNFLMPPFSNRPNSNPLTKKTNSATPPTLKSPSASETDAPKNKIFGVSLLDTMKSSGQPLPSPIGRALAYLEYVGGEAVGIFRRPGVKNRIADIRHQLDENPDSVDFHSLSTYDIADLIKLYFRELPGSLLTVEYSQLLINIFSVAPKEVQLPVLRDVVCLLPEENRIVLEILLAFLHKLSLSSQTNQMDISNLATCFSPSLFYTTNSNNTNNNNNTNKQDGNLNDSLIGQNCWERSGSTNGKRGQTMSLHHSHPHSTFNNPNSFLPQAVHHTSSNSADYVREASELKDQRAGQECLKCLIANVHVIFQTSEEMSRLVSPFTANSSDSKSDLQTTFSSMTSDTDGCLTDFLKKVLSSTIRDITNNFSDWERLNDPTLEAEVCYKLSSRQGHQLGMFVTALLVPVHPRLVMERISNERELWDDTLLSWNVVEKISTFRVNESDLRKSLEGIAKYSFDNEYATNLNNNNNNNHDCLSASCDDEVSISPSKPLNWSEILDFSSYSGDMVHYTTSFAPNSDLEFCEMRLWSTSKDDSISILLSTSVNHPSIPASNDIRCNVLDCRYVIVSDRNGSSKIYYFSQVDLKGHLPSWYEKAYGHLCVNHVKKLLSSFEDGGDL